MADNGTARRGFASMDPAKQKEIASKGGRAAHEKGRAHEFTSDEAREAGRKGGQAVSRNRAHMAEIGRQGGLHRAGKVGRSPTATEPQMHPTAPVESTAEVHEQPDQATPGWERKSA